MHHWRTVTVACLLASLVACLIVEIVAFANHEEGDTISEIVVAFTRQYPLATLAIGILLGHLFWPLHGYRIDTLPPK